MKKIISAIFIVFFGFLFFCSDNGVVPYQKEYSFPDKNISYYDHVLPLIDAKCGFGSGCHNVENDNNFLFYQTKENFINHEIYSSNPPGLTGFVLVRQEIDPQSPRFSALYLLLTENHYLGVERMPPLTYGREPLTSGELAGIEQWIKEGALD
ncbi:MAG: hypothetical protein D8M58_15125 [Calditrichaeota bacterium]|nr:MAG: hypothetical protein DWQ03_16365 [Calditrichota bacterium]MBL1206736.1 hypothetical protein [Calditrichota bacterium]NOG46562.1 hypothetical protein [Calditrichota bacterium]